MIVGRAGVSSERLISMHLVLLAFKSSWRPRDSHIGVPFAQVGKGSVECKRDHVICVSVGAVCKLK